MIRTRRATIRDLSSLVDINKSDIAEWHHFDRHGRGAKATYKELTEWERTMHGGPWMSLQPLRRYWSFAQKLGIICLVAEMDGRVVGHLDVIPTRELELGEYFYLDVFIVHSLYRRRGAGTELLKAAESLAIEKGLPKMIVFPAAESLAAAKTYEKFGFKASLEMCELEAKIDDVLMPSGVRIENSPSEPPLNSHHLLCGWFNTSEKLWKLSWRYPWDPELDPFDWHRFILSLVTESGVVHFLLTPSYPERRKFLVCIWAPPSIKITDLSKAVQGIKTIAQTLGAKTLTTLAWEKDRKMLEAAGFTWVKRHDPLLSKELSRV